MKSNTADSSSPTSPGTNNSLLFVLLVLTSLSINIHLHCYLFVICRHDDYITTTCPSQHSSTRLPLSLLVTLISLQVFVVVLENQNEKKNPNSYLSTSPLCKMKMWELLPVSASATSTFHCLVC